MAYTDTSDLSQFAAVDTQSPAPVLTIATDVFRMALRLFSTHQ
jgi:hypothetical protein